MLHNVIRLITICRLLLEVTEWLIVFIMGVVCEREKWLMVSG